MIETHTTAENAAGEMLPAKPDPVLAALADKRRRVVRSARAASIFNPRYVRRVERIDRQALAYMAARAKEATRGN